jgi:hypothetical protein
VWWWNSRLGGLVSVICLASLTRGNRGVIDELEKVLSVASDDGKLLAVLAHSIELVGESSLELLTGNVGQLSLGNERLGLSAHKFLLKNNNLRRVGLLVLQLSNLVGDLLLAWRLLACKSRIVEYVLLTVTAGLDRRLDVTNALNSDTVLVVAVDILVLKLTDFVDQDTELVSNIRNIVVARFSPDRELLLQHQLVLGRR